MLADAIAARQWPDRSPRLEPLGGGITNHNFKVVLDGEAYVLRVGGKDTELLGIDRHAEHAAALAAAAAGVGPEVVAFVEPEGALVTRFVDGRPVPPEELRSPAAIEDVAAALRTFQRGVALPARFDSFRVAERYAELAAARGGAVPDAYAEASRVASRIERARGPQPETPCHNDLLSANFLHDGSRLWIVDWEYAGMGDAFFDLANFSVNNGLDEGADDELLRAYFGERTEEAAAALTTMRLMSDFREAMWGVLQQAISELDFDFASYAAEHFDRLARTAAAPRFHAALRTLESS